MIVHSNKKADMPDKDLMHEWRKFEVTRRVWQYFQKYDPIEGLRTCDVDKIQYFRGQADLMDDLRRIFAKE